MTQTHTITDIILHEILERMHLTSVSQKQYESYKSKLEPMIENRIMGTLLESLTPEERAAFDDLSQRDALPPEAFSILFGNPDKMPLIERELTALVEELSMPL